MSRTLVVLMLLLAPLRQLPLLRWPLSLSLPMRNDAGETPKTLPVARAAAAVDYDVHSNDAARATNLHCLGQHRSRCLAAGGGCDRRS